MLQKKISGYILDLKQKLGKGVYGEVYLAVDTNTNQIVAVKQIPLKLKNQQGSDRAFQQIQNEIKIMSSVNNQNRTPNNMYIVMEYCNQGTLDDYIKKKTEYKNQQKKGARVKLCYLSEKEALLFMGQIVNGFKALYKQKIVHRDLKMQNILMHDGIAKIADFGFSKVIECEMEEQMLSTYAGSPLYMSIQILKQQQYSSKCDIWSLGIIMYEIIFGSPPWIAISIPDLIFKIENQQLRMPERPIVSQETKNLLFRMLAISEQQRIGWEELFQHPYFNEKMEIEEDNNLRQTVYKIDGEYKNDGLRRSNAKKNLYFEKNSVIQNTNHAEKEQKRFRKIFETPNQQENSPLVKQLNFNSNFANQTQDNISPLQSQASQRNKIFDQRQERSISPMIDDSKQQYIYTEIFLKNKKEIDNKKITQRISEWVIHRRNKSVFLNTISQKWFDLFDSGGLLIYQIFFQVFKEIVNTVTYYRFLFVLTKYQTIIFFKMNCRFDNKQLDKYNKFSKEQWYIFTRSSEFKTTASLIKNDFFVVKGFLKELIEATRNALESALKNDQEIQEQGLNVRVYDICNQDFIDKNVFDPIFKDNISYMYQLVKNLLMSSISKMTTQDALQSYLFQNKEVLIFAVHLLNAIQIKDIFKFSFEKPMDFFKYYEEINNESPLKLAQLIGLVK